MTGREVLKASGLAGLGWKVGQALAGVLLLALAAGSVVGWVILTSLTGDLWGSLVLILLGWVAVVALALWPREVARAVGELLHPGSSRQSSLPGGPFQGSHYTLLDERGRRRYDGSSGDLADLVQRLTAHMDPRGGTAVSPHWRTGWTFTVQTFDTRDEAYRSEGVAIDRRIGTALYLNKRREGRGRVAA